MFLGIEGKTYVMMYHVSFSLNVQIKVSQPPAMIFERACLQAWKAIDFAADEKFKTNGGYLAIHVERV